MSGVLPMGDADLVLTGGQVLTMVPGAPPAQAVALRRGRVLAVGSEADVMAHAGPRTALLPLAGRTVVPGLVDAHAHAEREGLKTLRPSLAEARSVADVLAVIAREAARTPEGAWIVTMPVGRPPYYFDGPAQLAEGRMPTRAELDGVAPRHPVLIPGLFGNWGVPPGYNALNSLGLERNGIVTGSCPECAGLEIEFGADGQPTGLIVENNKRPMVEFDLLRDVPAFGFDDRLEGLRRSLPIYHATGTTSLYEGHGSAPETISVYRRLWEQGGLTMRTRLCVSPVWSNLAEAKLAMRDWLAHARGRGLGDDFLRVSGVYIGLGGSAVSAAKVRRALPNTGWMGFVEWANRIEDFEDYATAAAEHDLRVHSVIGDRLGEVLDVFERIDRHFPLAGRRWVLEHIGAMDAADIPRLKRLGVMVSTIPFYSLWKNGKVRLDAPDEGNGHVPQRLLIEAGLPLAVGSDNVPPSMFHAMWASVVRRERTSGRVIGPAQALDRMQALATMTRHGAWLSFEESEKGVLAPGCVADLAVLSGDPLRVADDELPGLHALLTLVGGRVVHAADAALRALAEAGAPEG